MYDKQRRGAKSNHTMPYNSHPLSCSPLLPKQSLDFLLLYSITKTIQVNIDSLCRDILMVGGRSELVVHLEVTGLNVLRELLKLRALGGLLPGSNLEHNLHFLKGPAFSLRSREKHLYRMC